MYGLQNDSWYLLKLNKTYYYIKYILYIKHYNYYIQWKCTNLALVSENVATTSNIHGLIFPRKKQKRLNLAERSDLQLISAFMFWLSTIKSCVDSPAWTQHPVSPKSIFKFQSQVNLPVIYCICSTIVVENRWLTNMVIRKIGTRQKGWSQSHFVS